MKLLVDFGNSCLKWAFVEQENWQFGAELVSGAGLGVMLDTIWKQAPLPNQIVVASVAAEERYQELLGWIETHWFLSPDRISACQKQLGVTNCYQKPVTLGADRWAALIAARNISNKPVAIVDCGTAITVDALSADGTFEGGIIFPGLNLLRQSLITGTGNISRYNDNATHFPACSTEDAVAAGTLHGMVGGIEAILEQYRLQLGEDMEVLITGGDAKLVMSHLKGSVISDPNLVLKGLALIAADIR